MPALRPVLLTLCLAAAAVLAGCMAPPEGIECTADSEGNHISWDPVENATSYNVYRMLGDTDDVFNSSFIGSTTDTEFTDTDVTVGETYTYWVTSVGEWDAETLESFEEMEKQSEAAGEEFEIPPNESVPSEPCTVTAVPFFTSPVLGVVALAGCVGAYVVLRRRN